MEFKERDGRLKAAYNLVSRRISNLIVIGGDGSLTGANVFKTEWAGLLQELLDKGKIEQLLADECAFLNLVGMIGSIDNDMCGFSMTIGADSAMQRIVDACDALITAANSRVAECRPAAGNLASEGVHSCKSSGHSESSPERFIALKSRNNSDACW